MRDILLDLGFVGFRHTGQDVSFRVGSKVPDFCDPERRLLIEVYGDYPHRKEKADGGAARIAYFREHGWRTLIVWASEIRDDRASVILKLRAFAG